MYQGETLIVQFADTDGEFTIDFDSRAYPNQLVVRESDGIKGNKVGTANAILYHEEFGLHVDPDDQPDEALSATPATTPATTPGFFVCSAGVLRHTERVHCTITEKNGERTVSTLDHEGFTTGEYTYYPSVAAVEAALGKKFPRITI